MAGYEVSLRVGELAWQSYSSSQVCFGLGDPSGIAAEEHVHGLGMHEGIQITFSCELVMLELQDMPSFVF